MKRKKHSAFLASVVVFSVLMGIFVYEPLWNKISGFRPWSTGLDIAGGSYLVYEIDLSQVSISDKESVVKGLRDVIERRVNLFGVSEPRVYIENAAGKERLIVELAGIKDVNSAIREIGETPFLDFREVIENGTTQPANDLSGTASGTLSDAFSYGTSTVKFVATELNGRYIKSAQLAFDNLGKPQVDIKFSDEGAKIFEDITARNIGRPVAIFLDNDLIEVPVVQDKIVGGEAQITGSFTLDQAKTLVERFNAGALPAPIKLVNQQTISPDFGNNSMREAIFAGAIGTLAIIIFMLLCYREFGIYASMSLLMYTAITLSVFKFVPVTMTLAGIAGFLLSIGMAVDANILVFERTKEELAKGLTRTAAIEEGFRRAWTSIRDSNISTMITSAVLYYFTSSFVRGFALTLFIGVLISMFSAITVTRWMIRTFVKDKQSKTVSSATSI
ncbi:protein-export membrane protein SecD [Candidatus Jorgensenbacteria bacterium RIFCSPLOWO2_02_FULL_45_12]|uniref:Protein translocase subunit SecD n=2 Tax=Candidatus Joergenseniibacteriota TaxID=1752739 RepID=A0A1F6BQV9_9BACT|nr:MAG: Preprotein translocase subunit SecD [Candidatus Jorgensenbacteria bacterium GW2011_GWA2_45_9]OGG39152.1 MAG: protein-export membrane protein SecD [Candidatus Jorgensenbacteria bacterium RIFCSPHIGHO2_02_FULL_45_20]OGG42206.1 MAG: protein-export membrane protein SecD [Candidatus Jorgensenbacteria bacterium RIFCSPLOWO2_02_FULL_45_12]